LRCKAGVWNLNVGKGSLTSELKEKGFKEWKQTQLGEKRRTDENKICEVPQLSSRLELFNFNF
jgi:hypothetical protein